MRGASRGEPSAGKVGEQMGKLLGEPGGTRCISRELALPLEQEKLHVSARITGGLPPC